MSTIEAKTEEMLLLDPVLFFHSYWPGGVLCDYQEDILYSLVDNAETIVPAGHQLGKDWIAAFAILWFFMSRDPCRIITTSVDHPQLAKVLWGELRNFISTSKYPLPLIVKHMEVRKIVGGKLAEKSYIIGRVARKGEGMTGHHLLRGPNNLPMVMGCFDESSGIDHETYDRLTTCTHCNLIVGNPYECENFFKKGVKAGDQKSYYGDTYRRFIIKITAEQSPNVKEAISEMRDGIRKPEALLVRNEERPWGAFSQEEYDKLDKKYNDDSTEPEFKTLVPGVLGFREYIDHRMAWDPIEQCIKLDGEFYEGSELKMYPSPWLDLAERVAKSLNKNRRATCLGIDPAEGGDNTVWALGDEKGLIHMLSRKTPDTSVITSETIRLMREHGIDPQNVLFDRGGGGKEHADRLRSQGFNVRTIGFGEPPTDPKKYVRTAKTRGHRINVDEIRYAYKNRRAEMAGILRQKLNPENGGFGLPELLLNRKRTDGNASLRKQMEPVPMGYDEGGRLKLPPKRKAAGSTTKDMSLEEIIGCSPDEWDALLLMTFGTVYQGGKRILGSLI